MIDLEVALVFKADIGFSIINRFASKCAINNNDISESIGNFVFTVISVFKFDSNGAVSTPGNVSTVDKGGGNFRTCGCDYLSLITKTE